MWFVDHRDMLIREDDVFLFEGRKERGGLRDRKFWLVVFDPTR